MESSILPSFQDLVDSLGKDTTFVSSLAQNCAYDAVFQPFTKNSNKDNKSYITQSKSGKSGNLITLAEVSDIKNQATLAEIKEEMAFEFLIDFFKEFEEFVQTMNNLSKSFKASVIGNTRNLDGRSQLKCSLGYKRFSREKFQAWIKQIPDHVYTSLLKSMIRFTMTLEELHDMMSINSQELEKPTSTNSQPVNEAMEIVKNIIPKLNVAKSYSKASKFSAKSRIRSKRPKKNSSGCRQCKIKDTPEWRRGPDGSRTMCNACGLFYSKLVRKFGLADSELILNFKRKNKLLFDRTIPTSKEAYEMCKSHKSRER